MLCTALFSLQRLYCVVTSSPSALRQLQLCLRCLMMMPVCSLTIANPIQTVCSLAIANPISASHLQCCCCHHFYAASHLQWSC